MSIFEMFDLKDRVAVITGARRGLRRAVALALAEAGADIAAGSRRPASDLASDVEILGRRCVPLTADLEDPEEVKTVVPRAVRRWAASISSSITPA